MMNERSVVLETPQDHLERWQDIHKAFSFEEYLEMVQENPALVRTSFEYLYDMVMSYGTEKFTELTESYTSYRFFSDQGFGDDRVFGLERALAHFMEQIESAARRLGPDRRLLLLHGPVGSSKSSIVRMLKRGMERYSETDAGAVYSYSWRVLHNGSQQCAPCPLNEQPLKLIPIELRISTLSQLGASGAFVEGELCPFCQESWDSIVREYQGDWAKMLRERILVRRVVFNENKRIGLGSFKPKDPKDQDPTELLGDVNYRKLSELGVDSSPFAFSFDGEFEISNRGLLELIELLKSEVSFLYEFLEATQSHTIKPKKFTQVSIDEVLIAHTNSAEFEKLMGNEFMEAFRDRTIRIDIPYLVKWGDEVKIYRKVFERGGSLGKHVAPHAVEMAALWAVLTRLEKPKKDITLIQKAKLYDGRDVPGWTEQQVRDMRNEADKEGMSGISPRYIQDKLSNAMINTNTLSEGEDPDPEYPRGCINPFHVLNEIEDGLSYCTLITSEEKRTEYKKLLADVKKEYEDMVKDDVRRAMSTDDDALSRLCSNYLDNVRAHIRKEKVKNKFTGKDQEPDEKLMRSVEERIDVGENRKDTFRVEIMGYIGALATDGKSFTWESNDQLKKALELKLFEDNKDTMKLVCSGVLSTKADQDQLEKIDLVKGRLIKDYGYCCGCATDILVFVSSVFARGDS